MRTRLYLLTALVFFALLVAMVSAFRTARTTTVFAQRQAIININWAVRELAREAADFETNRGDFDRNRKLPPHLREIYSRYNDEFSRTTAATLYRFEEVSGGFCTTNSEFKGEIFKQNFSAEETSEVKKICRELSANNETETKRIVFGGRILYIAVLPITDENNNFKSNSINGVFAAREVAQANIFADRFNLLTQMFLLISIIISIIFAFLTLRDWRSGMFKIETGLSAISGDLSKRIDEPKIDELNIISREINNLAKNLESNIARQKQLENDLARNEKLAALGRVASGVAHEVRNPLASMKLKIQLAERNKTDKSKLNKTFNVLLEEIERLDGLVRKLLDVSRPSKMNLSEINLVDVIGRRISLIKEKAELNSVKIETSFAENLNVEADGEKLAQVFDNLLLNAVEAMPNGGILKVLAGANDNKAIVEISDEGTGISDDIKARLFEPFFTTKDKGTGLGLAISREIIEAHSGRLYSAESENGAKFVIELPTGKMKQR